jgi:hypothetical protein
MRKLKDLVINDRILPSNFVTSAPILAHIAAKSFNATSATAVFLSQLSYANTK